MTPERWRQIEDIFERALETLETQRAAYLDRTCPADLRAEIDAMLAVDRAPDTRLEEAISEAAEAVAAGTVPPRVGAYELVGRLGRGGMGAVYLGKRADGEYERNVAIKFLRFDNDSQLARERFRLERQILADLDHPYIARLVDGGATPEGLPYIVLEYVDGQQIDAWRRDRKLNAVECGRLLLKVCEAVSYAHSKLVVHRDLKPSNILVTPDGLPKLLDFGVAKLLSPAAPSLTQGIAHALFTPEYASPEQVQGRPITTATDVYALGATLYALLAGRAPFHFQTTSPAELLQVICGDPLSPPSSWRKAPGDLDRIVLMAMQRDPALRYRSVDALADDLTRFLDGLPVRARGRALAYRARKFLRRNLIAVAASVAVAALMAGATVVSVRQAGIAERARQAESRERRRADTERRHALEESAHARYAAAEAERLKLVADRSAEEARRQTAEAERRFRQVRQLAGRFLFEFHDSVKSLAGALPSRRLIVKTALEYLDSLAKDRPGDPELRRELAGAFERVGDAQGNPYYSNLGDAGGAIESYRRALDLRQSIPGKTPELAAELMMCHTRLGDAHDVSGDKAQSERDYNAALALGGGSQHPAVLEAAARVYLRRGDLMARTARNKASLADYREADRLFGLLRAREPSNLKWRDSVNKSQRKLARALYFMNDLDEALRIQKAAIEDARGLAAADAANSDYQRNVLMSHMQIADTYTTMGRLDFALDQYLSAAVEAGKIARPAPDDQRAQSDLAEMLGRAAGIYLEQKKYAEAIDYGSRSVAILDKLNRTQPFQVHSRMTLAAHRLDVAAAMAEAGRADEADGEARDCVRMLEDLEGKDPSNRDVKLYLIHAYRTAGRVLQLRSRAQEAVPEIRKAIALLEELRAREPESRFVRDELPLANEQLAAALRAAGGGVEANARK